MPHTQSLQRLEHYLHEEQCAQLQVQFCEAVVLHAPFAVALRGKHLDECDVEERCVGVHYAEKEHLCAQGFHELSLGAVVLCIGSTPLRQPHCDRRVQLLGQVDLHANRAPPRYDLIRRQVALRLERKDVGDSGKDQGREKGGDEVTHCEFVVAGEVGAGLAHCARHWVVLLLASPIVSDVRLLEALHVRCPAPGKVALFAGPELLQQHRPHCHHHCEAD